VEDFVKELCKFGDRKIGSQGHLHAQNIIKDKMKQIGLVPYNGTSFENFYDVKERYKTKIKKFNNIIGKIKGSSSALDPILITAHYDTCGKQPGADDNAAAIAIMFKVAEYFVKNGISRDLIIASFDAEEPPNFQTAKMGCVRFYEDQRLENIDLAIVMDSIGHDTPIDGLEDTLFVTGFEGHTSLEKSIIMEDRADPNLKVIPVRNEYIGDLSDHYAFNNKTPFLFYTCGVWEHYHQKTDTPEKLNYAKMERIAESIIRLIKNVESENCSSTYKTGNTNETFSTEKMFYGKYFHSLMVENLDMSVIKDRRDIVKIVDHLLYDMHLTVF
jgi:hypothetical protein